MRDQLQKYAGQIGRSAQICAITIACSMITGCGKKGDLFLPQGEGEQAITPQPLPTPPGQSGLSFPEELALPAEEETGLPAAPVGAPEDEGSP